MTRTFIDALQHDRCRAVVTLRDKSTADCGRRAVRDGLCTQHLKMAATRVVVLGVPTALLERLRPALTARAAQLQHDLTLEPLVVQLLENWVDTRDFDRKHGGGK